MVVNSISARVLGQRIRQLRTRRGMTQQDLAGEDYSKSYISAIEQGKTRPSLQALQRMAARLDVPAGTLLDPDAHGFAPFDPEAMHRRVRRRRGARGGLGALEPSQIDFQLAQAELGIYTGNPSQSLEALRGMLPEEPVEGAEGSGTQRMMDSSQTQRVYYLAALAAVRSGASSEAVEYVQSGQSVAMRVGDREMLERLHNLLGVAYYQMNQPLSALEQHRECLQAVESGSVRDTNLKFQVYANIAADYWALHDTERALSSYKAALGIADEVNSIERQAGIFQDLASSYSEMHDYYLARPFALKAASIYEALDNVQLVARMENRYGDILVETGDMQAAEAYLSRSLELTRTLNSDIDRAVALTNLARFNMKRGNLDEAESHAQQAVDLSRGAVQGPAAPAAEAKGGRGKGGGAAAAESATGAGAAPATAQRHAESVRVLSMALAVAGEVATQKGDAKKADQMFNEAIELIEQNEGAAAPSDIYQRYAQVLAGRGEHEQASRYFERAYRAVTKRGS